MSSSATHTAASPGEVHDDIVYPAAIPFVIVHLVCFAVIWTGFTTTAVVMAFVLYFVRMWALTGGYHRYFSHRSYRTSRVFQFFIALLGQTSAQRGVVWWSAVHRHHHLYSDTPQDTHSPRHMGFMAAHVGWIFRPKRCQADYSLVPDLLKFPELVWLNKHPYFPAALLAVATYLIGGWPGLIVGFFMSTVVLYHCVFFINSLAHVVGKQRYLTGDDSRNNWWLALITLGEGWHNNHHYYQSATAQGWRWYEVDISYYVIKVLSWLGLVWDLREPPAHVVRGELPIGRKVLERVARELATSFAPERIAEQIRSSWAHKPTLEEIVNRIRVAGEDLGNHASDELAALSVPHLPTLEELRVRAEHMFNGAPSLEIVAARAREMLEEAVSMALLEPAFSRT